MTDKEKIRKEVQRLMNELIQEKEKGHGSDIDDACILELQNVLTYIDSLPKESVSENRKEAILKKAHELANRAELISDKFPKSTLIAVAIDMAEWCDSHPIEEPVSKELEEAAEKYAYELFPSIGVANTETELAFKAGAQWKEKHMMKNAINAGIYKDSEDCTLHAITVPINNVEFGERVKAIIIKDQ